MKTFVSRHLAAAAFCALLVAPAFAGTGIATRLNGNAKSSSNVQGRVPDKDVITVPSTNPRLKKRVIDKDVDIIDPKTRPALKSRLKDVDVAQGVRIKTYTVTYKGKQVYKIGASLVNFSKNADQTVSWRLSWSDDAKKWSPFFQQGGVVVPAGGMSPVAFTLNADAPEMNAPFFKIDVLSRKSNLHATQIFIAHPPSTNFF